MDALGLNITDWAILVIVIASGIISLFRGFTKEFLSLFLWVFSFLVFQFGKISKKENGGASAKTQLRKIMFSALASICY